MSYVERIKEHLERTDAALDYLDGAIDKAVAITDAAIGSTAALHAKFEPFTCIFPLAPIDKIAACLAGGGLVCAIVGTRVQWAASAISNRNNVRIVQLITCNASEAKVIYFGGETDVIKDPAKLILAGCLFWVGA